MESFNREKKPEHCYIRVVSTIACIKKVDSVDQDQTARSVQSDLDLHCTHKQYNLVTAPQVLSILRKKTNVDLLPRRHVLGELDSC